MIDDQGWMDGALRVVSPNSDRRPSDAAVELVVIHAISLPPEIFGGHFVTGLFTNSLDPVEHDYFSGIAALRVSSHLFIRRDGGVVQFVSFDRRAWHAGVSSWRGRERCNDFAIGIELEGSDTQPFTEDQYASLLASLREIRERYPVIDVVGHSDIAPGRKTDPGPCFDWMRLSWFFSVTQHD